MSLLVTQDNNNNNNDDSKDHLKALPTTQKINNIFRSNIVIQV